MSTLSIYILLRLPHTRALYSFFHLPVSATVVVGCRHRRLGLVVLLGCAVTACGRAAPQAHDHGPVARQLVREHGWEEAASDGRQLAQESNVVGHKHTHALLCY